VFLKFNDIRRIIVLSRITTVLGILGVGLALSGASWAETCDGQKVYIENKSGAAILITGVREDKGTGLVQE
jgi:hypothetical protein